MSENGEIVKLKINDRVKKVNQTGCLGTVKDVRTETLTTSTRVTEIKDEELLVNVQWDNGTLSYLSPQSLEVVKA